MKQHLILGAPGCGKTHKLLSLLDERLVRGVSPEEIGFVSFTKKAANEAKERAQRQFGFKDTQMQWFRTLHSLAFHQLGYSTKETMKKGDYTKIGFDLGMPVSGQRMIDDLLVGGQQRGDRLIFMENLARLRKVPLEQVHSEALNDDIDLNELKYFRDYLVKYKANHLLIDFTDMITEFNKRQLVPDLRVLFVDEAQDLCKLQWEMVEVLARGADVVYIAGDDDQAIYKWAGADVDHFLSLEGEKTVLGQSYRVPYKVHDLAHTIIGSVTNRFEKKWAPRTEAGEITWHSSHEDVDLSQGNWLVLSRNGYLLDKVERECLGQGYAYDSIRGSPIRPTALEAIKFWEMLRRGDSLTPGQVISVYDLMSVKEGFKYGSKVKLERVDQKTKLSMGDLHRDFGMTRKDVWHDALDRISDDERAYVLMARSKGETLNGVPRIKISTIHGAKGGEADNVLLLTDMAYRHVQDQEVDPDSEQRCWYVAVTRTKKNLHIVQPQTHNYFEL